MPKFVLTYHGDGNTGDMPTDQASIDALMAEWGAWYETMGSAVLDGGDPFGPSTSIDSNGPTDNPAELGGYTIIEAADMAAATAHAQGCPVLKNGHTVQISEAMNLAG